MQQIYYDFNSIIFGSISLNNHICVPSNRSRNQLPITTDD